MHPLGPGGLQPFNPLGPGGLQPVHPLGPGGLQPLNPLGPGGLQPFNPPAPNPCPNGSCPAQPVADLYNACSFGTAYMCGPAETLARATSNPVSEALTTMGPQATCVFPGGVCTSAPLGACIVAGGVVQGSGCCPGDKCINRDIPGFMSAGCAGGGGSGDATISARMERKAVLDVPGKLDKYTFFTKGCAQLVPGSYATLDGSAVESVGIFDGGAHLQPDFPVAPRLRPTFPVAPHLQPFFPVAPHLQPTFPVDPSLQPTFQGGSAAVAPVVFPGNTSGGMPFTFPSFNGAGTSIYAPVVIPNNSGTISITNNMSAGGGPLAPGKPSSGGSTATGTLVPGSTGRLVPSLVPGSTGRLVPSLVPGSTGRLVPGSHGNFVPGRLVPGSDGRLVPPFTPGPGPVIGLPPLNPPIDTSMPVGSLPLSAIHIANKRGQPTTVSSVVAGAKAGMAATKGLARMKHGQGARLKQSTGTLAVDGLVVLVDAVDDAGNSVGGVFHVPVGALVNKQPYMVSPSMASGPYGCSLQAMRNGAALHLDMV
jgi:hypothetical protein